MNNVKRGRLALAILLATGAMSPVRSQEPGFYYRQLNSGAKTAVPLAFGVATALPVEAMVGVSIPQVNWSVSGGRSPYFVTVTGAPRGLNATSSLGGAPEQAGNYTLNLTASDSSSPNQSQSVTGSMTVYAPFEAVPSATPQATGQVGQPISPVTIVANGGKQPYTFGVVGNLPVGVGLDQNTGLLSGSPQTHGTYNFQLRAAESFRPNAPIISDQYSMYVAPAPLDIASSSSIARHYVLGTPLATTAALTASGGTAPYSYTTTGTIPAGMSLLPNGTLAGTPDTADTYNFAIVATDSSTPVRTVSMDQTITVHPGIVFANTVPPYVNSGETPSAFSFTATGGMGGATFALSQGSLPPGLTLQSNGTVVGTVQPGTGSASFTVRATDSEGNAKDTNPLAVGYATPMAVVAGPLIKGKENDLFNQPVVTGGREPYNITLSTGSLPSGLSFTNTGRLTGSPGVGSAGNYGLQITALDIDGRTSSRTVSLTIDPLNTPVISTASLPIATQRQTGYSASFSVTGGTPPFSSWTLTVNGSNVTNGSTIGDTGLRWNSNGSITGTVSGTASAQTMLTLTVRDGAGLTSDPRTLALNVNLVPSAPIYPATNVANLGATTTILPTSASTGGSGTKTYQIVSVSPASGAITITNSSTGAVTVAPNATVGNYSVTVRTIDAAGTQSGAGTAFAISVASPITPLFANGLTSFTPGQYMSLNLAASGGSGIFWGPGNSTRSVTYQGSTFTARGSTSLTPTGFPGLSGVSIYDDGSGGGTVAITQKSLIGIVLNARDSNGSTGTATVNLLANLVAPTYANQTKGYSGGSNFGPTTPARGGTGTLTYSLAQGPSGLEVNPTTGTIFSGSNSTPTGTHTVRIIVTDTGTPSVGSITSPAFTVQVN